MIDPRGPRAAAALTTVTLAAALIIGGSAGATIAAWQWSVFMVAAALGPSRSPYGTAWRAYAQATGMQLKASEPEAGPRFAQACGAALLTVAGALHLAGRSGAAAYLVAVVAALAAILATTGICVGCRMYGMVSRMERLQNKANISGIMMRKDDQPSR